MLFQKNIIKKYLTILPAEKTSEAWEKYQSYFLNADIQQNILQSKEEQFQEGFLRELFVKILGYTLNPSPNFNLITEQKNETNAKKADGAILLNDKVIGVIELKDHKTTDLSKVETQAFGYKSQHEGTHLVVISNFEKLRLYIDDAVEYREWNLFTLSESDFRELYLCLAWPQVERGVALQMNTESVSSEDQITNALYKDYSRFKRALFSDLLACNPYLVENKWASSEKSWQLLLFKKTQKLLDRLLFIFFAEDGGLLTPNAMVMIVEKWKQLKELDAYVPLYDRIKQYFGYLNEGHQGKPFDVYAYNGGLFKPDDILDSLTITDAVLEEHTLRLATYDYESDVDVNILGHIFENSLSEIEEVTQQIEAGIGMSAQQTSGSTTSKRKQDGVFYTPQYITKYIVENTVGRLCAEKKQQLGIVEEEYYSDQRRQLKTKQRLLDQLKAYRDWLLQLTILDPACGSGAFLNAALQHLIKEHKLIDEMEKKVLGYSLEFHDIEHHILENNLFGVDINEESVGIAQLSLWLRTAKRNRKLNTLNQNIKCGNSLISDPAVAGDKAFDWQKEFPQVFKKGGFDVVIGNPPYVQLQSMGEMSDVYAKCGFETYNKSADLYCLFYEKGCNLLKEKGLLGFIASNKWLKINYGIQLRHYLTSKMNPLLLVDFPGVPVFEDATVDPQILIVEKATYSGETFACAIKERIEDISSAVELNKIKKTYDKEPWTIRDARVSKILSKMETRGKALKDLPVDIYRGILTGFNDAFYIDGKTKSKLVEEDSKSEDIIMPLYRGRDITAWITENQDLYLINTHNGLKEKDILPVDIEDYPAIKRHLDKYFDKLVKRGDKGNTPYNLRNCAYLDEFAKPKIVYPNMTKYLPFSYDESKSLVNQKCYILTAKDETISLKFLTAVFNSRLIKLWIRCVCPELGEDRREIGKVYFEKLHVPTEAQQPFIALADTMLSLHQQLQEKRSRFLQSLIDNFEGVKISTALQQFDTMDFKGLLAELKKQKVYIPVTKQEEWKDYFNQRVAECCDLSAQIKATDDEIDNRVFDLYGLTAEERDIILK